MIVSVGTIVAYKDIYFSYRTALMGTKYVEFFRKKEKIISFEEIQSFRWITQNEQTELSRQILPKYISLKKYESDRGGFLLSTLQELVRTQFNYQEAAKNLHVHLNTLYYRQEKLSKVLGDDFSSLETKIKYYYEMFLFYLGDF